jgi:hypothetical protein
VSAAVRTVAAALALALAAGGCVERRIHVTSEPTGARVWLNDVDVGVTPLEVDFNYFGVYDVRLRKEGFEPLATTAEAEAPFHEWPVIDFFALAWPGTKRTDIRWHFEMAPEDVDTAALLERAVTLRDAEEARAAAEAAEAEAGSEAEPSSDDAGPEPE